MNSRVRVRRALTLLEVLISVTLIGLLMGAALTFFWQTVEIRDRSAKDADRTQIARQVLDRLSTELRGCVGFDQVGFPVEQRLIGDRRSITFLTTAMPSEGQYSFVDEFETPLPGQHDLRVLSYSLWVDPENTDDDGEPIVGGIIRGEKKTLNQFIVEEEDPYVVRNDLWSNELAYLEFRYFDGIEWDTKWDITEGNSLPQVVAVIVGFKPITADELDNRDLDQYPISEYPLGPETADAADRYIVVVRLPAADKFFSSRVQRLGKQVAEQLGVGGTP